MGNGKNIVTISLVEEGYEGRAGEGIVKVSQGYIRLEMAKLIMVSIYLSRLSLCSASCYVVHIICSKLNLITLMFVSVSSQYYQAASIFIPPEEINFPLPDLYHGIVIRLILEGLLNQQDAQHLVVTDIPSCLKNP